MADAASDLGGPIVGHEVFTNADLATAQTLTLPSGARRILIQPLAEAVRFMDNGTTPTASLGIELAAGSITNYGADLENIKFIRSADTAALELTILYYG